MAKSKNKKTISLYIKKLNEIDVNSLIASLNNINLSDLKKIDIKDLTRKIRNSSFFKPAIGFIGASLFFTFLLIPSVQQLISSFNKSRRYQEESNSLAFQKSKLKNLDLNITKSSLLLSELNESIIANKDIIFISKLINQTALKSNVDIISIVPVDIASSGKLCREPNRLSRSRKGKKVNTKKGSFQDNYFEIKLLSNYFDLIRFLNIIQYYDVVMLPKCLEVLIANNNKNSFINSKTNPKTNLNNKSSKIIPLSESGFPIDSINSGENLNLDDSFNQVEIRLVLQIPSRSR